tara:strand:- start:872 stop:1999 length:1128 start_codon:yes stop_codon:yes gene_type:complete
MGKKVEEFEKKFAKWTGSKYSVMVNSGSSANLLVVESLLRGQRKKKYLKPGDEVIVPALTWPTTIWPIVQLGLVPVFVDSNKNDLSIDFDKAEAAVTRKTKAVFMIHVLGNCSNIEKAKKFCDKFNLILLEDCCESLGSHYKKKHIGNFGLAGTFSFYFAHHICSIEGGAICTNDKKLADDLRSFRAHGWIRNRSDKSKYIYKNKSLDDKFLFVTTGYNVRPTEINAAMGLEQLKRLSFYLNKRDSVVKKISKILSNFSDLEIIGLNKLRRKKNSKKNRNHSWMNLPLFYKKKSIVKFKNILKIFKKNGIETRSIIAGNMIYHPVMKKLKYKIGNNLQVSDEIFKYGFMIGCHPNINTEAIKSLKKAVFECQKIK